MSKEYSKLEASLDKAYSEYIRLKAADDNGYIQCITCGVIRKWNDGMHNGHYISRAEKATRFNDTNCQCQCLHCNNFREGKKHIFRQRLVEKYGEDEVKKLEQLSQVKGGYKSFDLKILIPEYRAKVRALKKEKGL